MSSIAQCSLGSLATQEAWEMQYMLAFIWAFKLAEGAVAKVVHRAAPAFSRARAPESPRQRALVHSLSTERALPWQPTLLAEPTPIVSAMHAQKRAPPVPASEATNALLADSATALFCKMYMLHAAASRGVL